MGGGGELVSKHVLVTPPPLHPQGHTQTIPVPTAALKAWSVRIPGRNICPPLKADRGPSPPAASVPINT